MAHDSVLNMMSHVDGKDVIVSRSKLSSVRVIICRVVKSCCILLSSLVVVVSEEEGGMLQSLLDCWEGLLREQVAWSSPSSSSLSSIDVLSLGASFIICCCSDVDFTVS